MNRHRRRTARMISLATSIAVIGGLTACGPGGGTSSDPGGSAAPEGASDSLTLWTFKQSHVEGLENAAKGFEEETGISVSVEAITPDDAFVTKVQAAAQTGDLPDIFEVHTNGDDFAFGGAGLLEDLSSHVDDEWTSRYLPSVADEGTVTPLYYEQSLAEGSKSAGVEEGQRFSVPLTIGTFGIVYANKARLAEAGITEAPTTWEQFVADLDAVEKSGVDGPGLSIGFQASTTGLEWLMQPMAFGMLGKDDFGALFSDDDTKNFASPNGQAVLETYNEITPYWMPGTQSLTIDDADIAFAQGKSTFNVGGTFTLAFLDQNGMDADDIITFPVPSPEGAEIPNLTLAPFALTGLSVSATSQNKDGAIQFLDYIADADVAAQFAQDSLDVPPVDLGDDPSAIVGPVLGAMFDSFGEGDDAYNPGDTSYRPSGYEGPQVADMLMEMSPLGIKDPAETGNQMATIIDMFWSLS